MKALFLLGILATMAAASHPAAAQPAPGIPFPGCQIPTLALREGVTGTPMSEVTIVPLPCPVSAGFVVLVENAQLDVRDPRNWSDVLIFNQVPQGPPQPPGGPAMFAVLVSDSSLTSGAEVGIDPNYFLSAAGFPLTFVQAAPTTVYLQENVTSDLNPYKVVDPTTGVVTEYDIFSDPPENPTPAASHSWGQVKALYR